MKKIFLSSIIILSAFVFLSTVSSELVLGQVLPDFGDGGGGSDSSPPPPPPPPPPTPPSGGGGLVPDCPPGGCGWAELLQLAQNIMNFLIAITIPLSAIAFAWAGFLYLSSSGSEDKIKKAHGIFTKVAIGLFFVLAAWLLVWLITTTFLDDKFILLRQ